MAAGSSGQAGSAVYEALKGVADDEEAADLKEAPPADAPLTIVWLEGTALLWAAAFLMFVEHRLNRVVDFYMQNMCNIATALMMLRLVPPWLEYIGMASLGLAGIALHLDGAHDGEHLAVLQIVMSGGLVWHGLHGIHRMFLACINGGGARRVASREMFLFRKPGYVSNDIAAKIHTRIGACGCLLQWFCSTIFCLLIVLLVAFSVLFFATEDLCAVESFDARLLLPENAEVAGRLPPMRIGTTENINLAPLPINLTGLWWIRWHENPVPTYKRTKLEEVVSMAGLFHKGDYSDNETQLYPVPASAPTGRLRQWGFSNSLVSRVAIMVTALQKNPLSTLNMDILNATDIFIRGGGENEWTMHYRNDDEWIRYIRRPEADEDWQYTLTRIVYQDGSPSRHFEAFVSHMAGTRLRVFNTDSWECRKCGALPFGRCRKCASVCAQ